MPGSCGPVRLKNILGNKESVEEERYIVEEENNPDRTMPLTTHLRKKGMKQRLATATEWLDKPKEREIGMKNHKLAILTYNIETIHGKPAYLSGYSILRQLKEEPKMG